MTETGQGILFYYLYFTWRKQVCQQDGHRHRIGKNIEFSSRFLLTFLNSCV